MDYKKIRNKFYSKGIKWWIGRGVLGFLLTIILLPFVLIRLVYLILTRSAISYEAYEKIIKSNTQEIVKEAFYNLGIENSPTTQNNYRQIVSYAYTPIEEERILVRNLSGRVQSTCVEATVIMLDDYCIRVYSRKFSTILPIEEKRTDVFAYKEVLNIAKSSVRTVYSVGVSKIPITKDKLIITTSAGVRELTLNNTDNNLDKVFLTLNGALKQHNILQEKRQAVIN